MRYVLATEQVRPSLERTAGDPLAQQIHIALTHALPDGLTRTQLRDLLHRNPPDVLNGPKVRLPSRDYLLFEGPLEAAAELGGSVAYRRVEEIRRFAS